MITEQPFLKMYDLNQHKMLCVNNIWCDYL